MGALERWRRLGAHGRAAGWTGFAAVLCLVAGVLAVGVAGPAGADQGEAAARRVAAASITAGDQHTCALAPSGAVRCWGDGVDGQLGHNASTNIGDGMGSDPSIKTAGVVPVSGRAVAVAAGDHHTCALLAAGKVSCWGNNAFGQLGHDNTLNIGDGRGTDPSIHDAGDVPLGGPAVAIAAGAFHTCALLATEAVRCWGDGSDGQLGHNQRTNIADGGGDPSIGDAKDVPLGGSAVAIAAGDFHTCALLTTGAVRCWGYGFFGQLGHDTTTSIGDGGGDPSIKQAGDVPLGGPAVAITAGGYHTCALLADGAVRCWGYGAYGQLGHDAAANIGDGGSDLSIEDAKDVPLGGQAVAIAAGANHTCAVLGTGKVRCWGDGGSGQLGHDTTTNIGDGGSDPSIEDATDVPVGADAVAVTTGAFHTCALLTGGTLRCWGDGEFGQLGHDSTASIGAGGTPITAAGDVPVGTPVRITAPVSISATVGPWRDRQAPYVYGVTGHLRGRFMPDRATCTGKITLTVRSGDHRLKRHATELGGDCGFRFRMRLAAHELPTHQTTGLTFVLHYHGSPNLTPAATTRHAKAR